MMSKATRLIDYLPALSKINGKIVRNLSDYKKVLWIDDIRHEPKHCFAQSWGQEDEHDSDVWIEVKKFKEPNFPKVPQKCSDWAKQETLGNNTKDFPELYKSIVVERTEEDPETGEEFTVIDTLNLENYPDIQQSWDDYLEKRWVPWSKLYNRYDSVQKVYAELFHIHQEQQKLGEQYDLIFCKGLLNWKTPSGHNAKRHIIIAKASLEFEPNLGKFTVKQAVDSDLVDIELDMLDIVDKPQNAHQLVEKGRKVIGANLWDKASIDMVLTSIANSLADSGQGEYYPDRLEPQHGSSTEKPTVEFAPALILRKRSMRGLDKTLASMKEQIEAGEIISDEFLDLCESLPDENGEQGANELIEAGGSGDDEIYFPLRANDEQRKIIRTLNRQKGVLVQGPPGTGKSHTIANLICHLLATGKRVLVTAKTPRALKVLHEKLPSKIQPLCISLLGQGIDERESLRASVSGILTQLDRWNASNSASRIQALENQLEGNRKDKAETDNKIMAFREKETFIHNIGDGQYSGTAAQIARNLRKDAKQYEWFKDTISFSHSLPLSQDEIKFLCRYIVEIDLETEAKLSLSLPDIENNFPEGATVRIDFKKEAEAREKTQEGKERTKNKEGQILLHAGKEKIKPLLLNLSDFIAASETIRQRPMAWIEEAVYDVLTDRDTPWKELLKLSIQHANNLHELAAQVDTFDVSIPQGMDRNHILHDAKVLKEHFESGGGVGLWVFKPKIVREHGNLINQVKVDGIDCSNSDCLQKLIDFLTVEKEMNYIWSLWSGKTERCVDPIPLQLAEIDELHEALERIISLYDKREDVKDTLLKINGLRAPRWEDTLSLHSLVENCQVALAQIDYLTINKKLEWQQNIFSGFTTRRNTHPINARLLKAWRERDADTYCRLAEEVNQLCKKAKEVKEKKKIIRKLSENAPDLANHLVCCSETQIWAERLYQLDKAWKWAQGTDWLDDFLDVDLDSFELRSKRLDEDIRNDLAELAAVKAWQFCFSRMNSHHQRHLKSWQRLIFKPSQGTQAHTRRKSAQHHLNECRDAVPAWIMPLHRVYETVEAGSCVFDVIIVDEASQCGSEGLPLMYLGKQIIVVGDNKQISPEAVGIDRSMVQQLNQNFLYDFSFKSTFDIESSIFDHALIRFSNRISLREHFRCMPEIIRFSNDLCYRDDPLIPLRQYSPDRLEPLKAVVIQNGHREGSGARVINQPEAEALVDAIEKCCQDNQYQDKTMGVIVLQGEAQADHIEGQLLKRIGAKEMKKRQLICGNAYSFQGDERDVIFLSMVAAPNERIGAMTKPADERRFNVAASRARDQMWLFHSVTINDLSARCFRRRLLEHFLNPISHISQALGENAEKLREQAHRANRTIEKAPSPFDSWFELDVALQIASRGYRVVPQYKFAGKRIDLVIQGDKPQLAVECDGDFWHGADAYIADTERQRKLERCGWHFFRIRESCYYANPDKSLQSLWDLLDTMGIMPISFQSKIEEKKGSATNKGQNTKPENQKHPTKKETTDATKESHLNPMPIVSPSTTNNLPKDIHQALSTKPNVIQSAIIQVLEQRPKYSSVRRHIPGYVLKLWNIRTSGMGLR